MVHSIGLLVLILSICTCVHSHSGLYGVNTTLYSKDFSASYLMSKDRFIMTEEDVARSQGMASATFNVIRYPCKGCVNLVSRDFFDFMVEHLSSTTNQLPADVVPLFEKAVSRMKNVAQIIRSHEIAPEKDRRLDETMAVLVFSSNCFSKTAHKVQRTIRPAFFEVTFWSVYRYIKHIHVYVANEQDADIVDGMKLAYTSLVQLDTPLDHKNRTNMLPRDSMLHALRSLKDPNDPLYNSYKYVFYSEGDQALHMREAQVLYDAIDNSKGAFTVVPHRMQTQPVMQDYPNSLHHYWPKDTNQNLPHVEIAVENVHTPRGSCCNNGDIEVAKCGGGWWYQCPDWGLRNLTTWLKFGEYGFTMPPATEHKATCEYSSERVLCPQPKTCRTRYPKPREGHEVLDETDVCTENVHTVLLGPVLEQQAIERKEEAKKAALKARAKEIAFQRAVVEQLDEALKIDAMLMEKSDRLWEERMKALQKSEKEEHLQGAGDGEDGDGVEQVEQRVKGPKRESEDNEVQREKSNVRNFKVGQSDRDSSGETPSIVVKSNDDKDASEKKVASRTYGRPLQQQTTTTPKTTKTLNPAGDVSNTDINGDAADRAEAGVEENTVGEGDVDGSAAAPRVVGGSRKRGGKRGGRKGGRRKRKPAAERSEGGEGDAAASAAAEEGGVRGTRTRSRGQRSGGRGREGAGGDAVPKLDDIQ